jgi:site-specific recombinase XerD
MNNQNWTRDFDKGLSMANTNNVVSIDQRLVSAKNSSRNNTKSGRNKPDNVKAQAKSQKAGIRNRSRVPQSSHHVLGEQQVERLVKAAMLSRHGVRDATLILLAYTQGLKVSELINLKWDHIDFENESILVSRLNNGQEVLRPLGERELKSLRELAHEDTTNVFMTQRKSRMTNLHIRNIIRHAGEEAGLNVPVYPNMLSNACKFDLVSAIAGDLTTKH